MSKILPDSPEFSYAVEVLSLPSGGRTFEIKASEEECADVAKRLGLLKLEKLKASLYLSRTRGGFISVSGYFETELAQACVVTLAPIASQLRETISMTFRDGPRVPDGKKPSGGEELVSVYEDDPPELVHEGRIDLGELVVEQLVLALDPYPRAEGVSFGAQAWGSDVVEAPVLGANPFAALKKLREIKPH
jgi:uncharacterized metal-binding protein YceD (DUF177 family)